MLKIMCFAGLSFLLTIAYVRCDTDYVFNEKVGGWLKLHKTYLTWQEAFLRCHNEGAVMASPLNEQLTDALFSLVRKTPYIGYGSLFFGTHDLYSTGHFTSIEGVPLSDMTIKWDADGPTDAGDCLCFYRGRKMFIRSCTVKRRFICYRKLDNQTMNECGTFDDEYHFERCTGSCYKVHQQTHTWSQAFGICASEGGHLVILNDPEEARTVKKLFPERSEQGVWDRFHVGLAAWTDDRIWTTIHGDKLADVFNIWDDGQPNNLGGIQNRMSFVREGALDDIDPDFKAMFVCEKSPQSIQFVKPEDSHGKEKTEFYQLE